MAHRVKQGVFTSQGTFVQRRSPQGALIGLTFCLWGPQLCLILSLQLSGCDGMHLHLEGQLKALNAKCMC